MEPPPQKRSGWDIGNVSHLKTHGNIEDLICVEGASSFRTLNSNAVRCCLEVSLKSWKARDPSQKTYHDTYLEEQLSWVSWAFDTFALYFKRVSQTWFSANAANCEREVLSNIGCEAKIGGCMTCDTKSKKHTVSLCAVAWGCLSQGSFAKKVALVWTWQNYAPPHDLRQMRQKEVSSPGEAGITELLFWLLLFGAKLAKWPALEFVQIWFPFWSSLQCFQTLWETPNGTMNPLSSDGIQNKGKICRFSTKLATQQFKSVKVYCSLAQCWVPNLHHASCYPEGSCCVFFFAHTLR